MKPPLFSYSRSRIFLLPVILSLCAIGYGQEGSSPKPPSADAPCPPTGSGGTVNFANRVKLNGVEARVTREDNKEPLSGAAYLAQLYGSPCDREAAFIPLGKPVPFRIDIAAGYITANLVTLSNVAPRQPVFVQMRSWEATFPTYERALQGGGAAGKSVVLRVIAGGVISAGMGVIPPDLIGLKPFSIGNASPKQPKP